MPLLEDPTHSRSSELVTTDRQNLEAMCVHVCRGLGTTRTTVALR